MGLEGSSESAGGYYGAALTYNQHSAASNNNGRVLECTNGGAEQGNLGAVFVNGNFYVQDYSTESAVVKAEIRNDGSAYFYGAHTSGVSGLFSDKVGIGTSAPNAAYKLHVHGLAYATGAVIGNSYAGQSPPSNGLVVEGNVGIGYYAATNKLGVYGNANVGSSYQSIAAPSNGLIVEGDVGIGNSAPTSRTRCLRGN